ncbi:type II secretion system GspH family protein [Planococcus sp. 11815]|uniref:type IV pilus modification PilV family protein n=1 Tax=Planococcus sp. 11815 TaxID=2939413 RepID=UPI003DA31FEA
MNKLKSQQGLTLVEVLAALVILGIVFVGIMTVFPQMTLFNNKTEAKLDTMNLARQEMANITNADWFGNIEGTSFENQMTTLGYAKELETLEYVRFKKQDEYIYEIDLWKSCTEFVDEDGEGNECKFDTNTQVRLHQTHLKLYKQELLSSETFSYIRFRSNEVAN